MLKLKYLIVSFVLILLSSCSSNDLAIVDAESFEDVTLNVNLTQSANITTLTSNDYFISCAEGTFSNCRTIRKFGHNDAVGTSLEPITSSGFYRTPTSPVTLEAVSSAATDTNGSTGAWKIKIFGLNASGDEIEEEIVMNGTSSSLPTSNQYIRLFRAYVIEGGSYVDQNTASHTGTITLREQGGGQTWLQIDLADTNFGTGQSQVGVYTVPKGWTAYLMSKCVSVESNQPTDIYFYQRQNITKTTPPYTTLRLVEEEHGVQQFFCVNFKSPIQEFSELTDIGFMGKKSSAGTASVSVDFELLLIQNQ